ncbi:hypothetical protein ACQEVB_13855 [Pseudonocardia sp. CA-107938]|uniref:hypothetical protein n=1 Tax=Pseudonocardia sp. CA-107938 TaxID=3240021 RepID=UPI003D94EE04
MTTPIHEGDVIAVRVTKVLPFGVLVETSTGVPGLMRPGRVELGAVVDVRVDEFDGERFSAGPV